MRSLKRSRYAARQITTCVITCVVSYRFSKMKLDKSLLSPALCCCHSNRILFLPPYFFPGDKENHCRLCKSAQIKHKQFAKCVRSLTSLTLVIACTVLAQSVLLQTASGSHLIASLQSDPNLLSFAPASLCNANAFEPIRWYFVVVFRSHYFPF